MTLAETLMVIAMIAGPILAVQAQKWVETWREKRQRKIWVFKTLMASRGTPISPQHVQALNMIDLEFSDKKPKEKEVLEAWKVYLDHLSSGPQDYSDPNYQTEMSSWIDKSQNYHVDLLHTMGHALNYDYDKVQLKKGAYMPKGHADFESKQYLIQDKTLDLLYGKVHLLVQLVQKPQQQNEIGQENINAKTDRTNVINPSHEGDR